MLFVPLLGLAIGAASGALFGSLADVGISNYVWLTARVSASVVARKVSVRAQYGRPRWRPGYRQFRLWGGMRLA